MIQYLAIMAFVVPLISPSLALVIMNWVVGSFGQWLKAHKEFPTPLAHAIMAGVGIALYASFKHPTATDAEWFTNAIAWATSAIGAGSVMSSMHLVPKTDSIGG